MILLEELRQEVLSCSKCLLHQTRNNAVFGNGNPDAAIMLVAEAAEYPELVNPEHFSAYC